MHVRQRDANWRCDEIPRRRRRGPANRASAARRRTRAGCVPRPRRAGASASSTASAAESACASPDRSTIPDAAAATRRRLEHRGGVVERQRAVERPALAVRDEGTGRGLRLAHFAALRRSLVLRLQRLDQAVDAAVLDLLVELVAVVGHERDAADDDVVDLPARRRLRHRSSRSAPARRPCGRLRVRTVTSVALASARSGL